MSTLSLLDQMFFKLEQGGMAPLYMGGAIVVDPSESPYPIDGQTIANHVAAFMEDIPLMRQKLVQDKFRLGNMRRVDDPNFNVDNHIKRVKLKAPGGYKELSDYLGEFSSKRMDLNIPLWHYEIIEGLEDGHIAIASHLHHSMLDGIGAMRVLGAMFSPKPVEPREPSRKNWSPSPEPGKVRLARSALIEQAKRIYVETPKFVYNNAKPALKSLNEQLAIKLGLQEEKVDDTIKVDNPKPQKTSLNSGQISDKRVVAYLDFPLAEMKTLRKEYDCSINDLCLVMNSLALEYYFENIGEDIDFDLMAVMPIDTRPEGDKSAGTSAGGALVNLHNTEPNIKSRLAAIKRDTKIIKETTNRPTNVVEQTEDSINLDELTDLVSPIVLDGLAYMISRFTLFEKLPAVGNVMITNVPGPAGDLFISGAKVVGNIPMAPFGGPVALTVTISSSGDKLSLGYHGCGELIKDKELLVTGAQRAFDILKNGGGESPKVKPKTKAKTKPKAKAKSTNKAKSKAKAKRKPKAKAKLPANS